MIPRILYQHFLLMVPQDRSPPKLLWAWLSINLHIWTSHWCWIGSWIAEQKATSLLQAGSSGSISIIKILNEVRSTACNQQGILNAVTRLCIVTTTSGWVEYLRRNQRGTAYDVLGVAVGDLHSSIGVCKSRQNPYLSTNKLYQLFGPLDNLTALASVMQSASRLRVAWSTMSAYPCLSVRFLCLHMLERNIFCSIS